MFWRSLKLFKYKKENAYRYVGSSFFLPGLQFFAELVEKKCETLTNCVGLLDGTVIVVTNPGERGMQNALSNGHKQKLSLKIQAKVSPGGMIFHGLGLIESQKHDWILCSLSRMDEIYESLLSRVECNAAFSTTVGISVAHNSRFRFKVRICPMPSDLFIKTCQAYAWRWSKCVNNWRNTGVLWRT